MVIPLPPIKSLVVWTATTGALVATLCCDAEDTWLVALYVTELEFIILEDVRHTFPTFYSIDLTMDQIIHSCLCVVVDECSNVRQWKMLRQKILLVGVAVGINIRLEGGDDVGILGGGNCFEKHGRAIAGGEVDLLFWPVGRNIACGADHIPRCRRLDPSRVVGGEPQGQTQEQ